MRRIASEEVTGGDATVHWRGLGATAVVKLMPLGQVMASALSALRRSLPSTAALAILSTLHTWYWITNLTKTSCSRRARWRHVRVRISGIRGCRGRAWGPRTDGEP